MAQLLATTISGEGTSYTASPLQVTNTGSNFQVASFKSAGSSCRIGFFNSSGTILGALGFSSVGVPAWYNGSGTTANSFTDTKVTQSLDTGSSYRKLLFTYNSTSTAGSTITSGTSNVIYYNTSIEVQPSTGSVRATSFYASSDRRKKDNIKDLDLDCLSIINHLKLKEFNFKDIENKEDKYLGLIAQDLRAILPDKYKKRLVEGSPYKNGSLAISEGKVHYLTMGAVQQLSKKVDELEKKNKELEKRILQLEKLVNKLL